MKLRLTRQAHRDFDDAVDWFSVERPWLAERFLGAIEQAFRQIQQAPESFPLVEVAVANTSRVWRRVIIRPFSYVIVILSRVTASSL